MTRGLELGRNEMDIVTFRSCILFTPRKTMISFLLLFFGLLFFLMGQSVEVRRERVKLIRLYFWLPVGKELKGADWMLVP